jgi:hypothetical protein
MEAARMQATKDCEAKAPPCIIVMENDSWVGP